MGAALRMLMEFLGLKLIDTAISTILKVKMEDYLSDDPSTPDDESKPHVVPIDISTKLFGRNSVFRRYTDELAILIYRHRKNVHLSVDDILFSVHFVFKNNSYNELIYNLIQDNKIVVGGEIDKEIVSYDNHASDDIVEYCHQIFDNHLSSFVGHFRQQVDHIGFPHRVIDLIDQCFRPGSIIFGDRIIAIPPIEDHFIYDHTKKDCQKDIFGHELIFGKISIIKYKDNVSDVYTYGCVYPEPSKFDYSINYDWFLTDNVISTFLSKVSPVNSADLLMKEIPFTSLEALIKRLY